MNTKRILKSKQIDPEKPILSISAEEAISNLVEALGEYDLNIDFSKFSREDLDRILLDYADAVINYHTDDYHQERVTFIRNADIVTKYGLTYEDLDMMDFT